MELNARMWIDGLAGLFAPRAQTLHRPSQCCCVHLSHVAALPSPQNLGRSRLVETLQIVEDGNVASLCLLHLEKDGQCSSIRKRGFSQFVTRLRRRRFPAQVN